MGLERENSTVTASDVLAAIAAGEDVRLTRCTVSGVLDLKALTGDAPPCPVEHLDTSRQGETHIITLSQSLYFNSCTFENDVIFAGTWEQPDLMRVVFEKDVVFNSSAFKGQTRFSNAHFKGLAGFDGCTFSRVCSFSKVCFGGRTMFRTATFEGYGLFNDAVFSQDTRFVNASFGKGANYTNAQFRGQCDFAAVYSLGKAVPAYDGVSFGRRRFGDDESFWRFIKQSSQEAGYYQQAGECFYRERCAHFWQKFRGTGYERLSTAGQWQRRLWGIRLLPELIFGRYLFGYDERPANVLIAGVVIILLCGFFYSSDWAHVSYQMQEQPEISWFDGLYFSTVTFTTLGYGEVYPTGTDWLTRMVTMLESLSGICLITLFVVSLSKRFTRG